MAKAIQQETEDRPPFEWASSEQQAAVQHPPGRPLLLLGGFNSGKTSAAILHMIALAGSFPGYKVAVLRKTFKDLELTTRPSFDQWIDHKRVKSSTRDEVVLDNGSMFIFHHLDRPDAATILKGLEINAALLDQAEEMQERTFNLLVGRLGRWRGATVPKWVLESHQGPWPWKESGTNRPVAPISCVLTANPSEDGDPELHWLWQRFCPESPSFKEKWGALGYKQIVFDSRRNKFAGEANIQILMEQDDDYVARYVRGEWVKSKGHLFQLDERSILEPEPWLLTKIKNTMRLGRVLDHGDSAPTCCLWFGIDESGDIYFWQEYYQKGTDENGKEHNIADHRRAITALSVPHAIRMNLADPSIFAKTRNITGFTSRMQRWSVSEEYKDHTLIKEDTAIFWQPADNSETLSRERMKQYLKIDQRHKHPITGEYGAPHIYFLKATDYYPSGCVHAISEIRNAKRLQVGEFEGKPVYSDERDPTIPDHALDPVRYVVNSKPVPQVTAGPPGKQTAEVLENRVILTLPPIASEMRLRQQRELPRWRSKAGGY